MKIPVQGHLSHFICQNSSYFLKKEIEDGHVTASI